MTAGDLEIAAGAGRAAHPLISVRSLAAELARGEPQAPVLLDVR